MNARLLLLHGLTLAGCDGTILGWDEIGDLADGWGGQEGAPDGYDAGAGEPYPLSCGFDAADYGYTAPADPWDVVELWHWQDPAHDPGQDRIRSTLAVGDVDGDGDSEVAFTAFCAGGGLCEETDLTGLYLLDGATGEEIWRLPGYFPETYVAMVDVDGDGDAEILAAGGGEGYSNSDVRLHALDADGTLLWSSVDPGFSYRAYMFFTAADLDGDGLPEIATSTQIYDGATGAVEAALASGGAPIAPVAADLDLDGTMEVIVGQDAFAPDGTPLWTGPLPASGDFAWYAPAPVSYDADPEGELLLVGGSPGQMAILDSDGSTLAQVTLPVADILAHPPCVADFDGDGEQEFAVNGWTPSGVGSLELGTISVVELDGTVRWTAATAGWEGTPSCSAFDLNWDGAAELLLLDMDSAYVFDGSDGAVRYQHDGLGTATAFGYPVPADLDGDGSAELLLTASSDQEGGQKNGVIALSHAEGGWAPAGPAWPMFDYAVTNVSADLTLPAAPDPSWQCGYYRGRPPIDP